MTASIPDRGITAINNDEPAYRGAIARRIVEITDEDENLIFEFVALQPQPTRS